MKVRDIVWVLLITLYMCRSSESLSTQEIEAVVNTVISCRNIPGLAVAVVKDGHVVYNKGHGVTNLISQQPVTTRTLFGIASLTKAFTSTLVVKLLSEKTSFSVKTNAYKVLNDVRLFNNTLRSVYATLQDLLTHRLGIPRHSFIRLSSTLTRENLVTRVKYLRSRAAFRNSFTYSDLMYGMITQVIEHVGGAQWEDLMTTNILQPLGMTSTTFGTRQYFNTSSIATPYVTEDGVLTPASPEFIRHWGKIGGSGSMLSNAEDMAKWLLFHLGDGQTPDGTVLVKPDDFVYLHNPQNMISSLHSTTGKYFTRPIVPVTMSNDGYALGWKTGYYRGLRMLQHSGTTWGYAAMATLIPDKQIGIFTVMTGIDKHYFTRLTLQNFLADVFLGETPWLNATTMCSFPSPWVNPPSSSHRRRPTASHFTFRVSNMTPYAGTYRHEAYGNIIVRYNGNSLKAEFGYGQWTLHATSDTTFTGLWDKTAPTLDFVFVFKKRQSNVVSLKVPGFQTNDPPVFFKISSSPGLIG